MKHQTNANPRNLPAVINFAPTLEVEDTAPALKVDVNNPDLAFDDVLPSNFLSMEGLQRWLNEREAESRVLTVSHVSVELLYDPKKGEKPKDGEWKPVLWFEETESGLVINKTRGEQLNKIAGSPLLARWREIGTVALTVGIFGGKAQIGIASLRVNGKANGNGNRATIEGDPVAAANSELFG